MSKTVLAIVAHPDDIEFYAAGTLIKLRKAGYQLHFWNLADGGMGSSLVPENALRQQRALEAAASAELAGAVLHAPIFRDLEIQYTPTTLARVTAVVRQVRPTILITHPPEDYMEDHEVTCRLAVGAAFARGMPNFISDPPFDAVTTPLRIYHAMPHSGIDFRGRSVLPDIVVDIQDTIEWKRRMLALHESQHSWLLQSQGISTLETGMMEWSRRMGKISGSFLFGEGFFMHHHIGFCEPDFNPLIQSLPKDSSVILSDLLSPARCL